MLLDVKKLSVSFAGFTAVEDITFSLERGKTLAIAGESGSGKSLTALSIIGLLPKEARRGGEIIFYSEENPVVLSSFNETNWQEWRGNRIGMVFQEPMSALNPVMPVGDQIAEVLRRHKGWENEKARTASVEWLKKVQVPDAERSYGKYPHQLSGGQKQRVMIAIAMCCEPAILLADEPTTALDATIQLEILALMKKLQEESGTAMIFITHDLGVAKHIADELLIMYRGKMVEQGSAAVILQQPRHPYTQALLACRPSVDAKGKRLVTIADFGKEEPGQQVAIATASEEIILKVQDAAVWFPEQVNWLGIAKDHFKAVNGVSFELNKGEVLGLVGESGCGKSTLGRTLLGLEPLHSGEIFFNGNDISHFSEAEWRHVRKDIQLVFQDPYASLNPRMTIGHALMEPLRFRMNLSKKEAKNKALQLLELVKLSADSFDRYPHQFSGGQRQRINLARALSLQPKLLICDESVSALDISIQAEILNLLSDLKRELNLSMLFISHDLSVVHYISDRVLVMKEGKLVESGTADDVLLHPKDTYTQRLVDAVLS